MKIELEEQDLEVIVKRVSESLRPMLSNIEKRDDKDVIFDVRGLAEYLHVNPSWVYKQVSLKAIPYFKAGKFPRFKKRDIDKWTENKALRPIPSLKTVRTRGVST